MTCNRMPDMGTSIYLNGCSCECLWNELQTEESDHMHRDESCCGHGHENHEKNRQPNDDFASWPIAMTYVPMQTWEDPFDLAKGLRAGTIFPSLRLPFRGGGC